jgi:hypothetical protein
MTDKPATISNLVAENAALRERVESLESALTTLYPAVASLEFGLRGFKPLNLARPEHAALRAVVAAAPSIDQTAQSFTLPVHTHSGLRPRENRLANGIEVG